MAILQKCKMPNSCLLFSSMLFPIQKFHHWITLMWLIPGGCRGFWPLQVRLLPLGVHTPFHPPTYCPRRWQRVRWRTGSPSSWWWGATVQSLIWMGSKGKTPGRTQPCMSKRGQQVSQKWYCEVEFLFNPLILTLGTRLWSEEIWHLLWNIGNVSTFLRQSKSRRCFYGRPIHRCNVVM